MIQPGKDRRVFAAVWEWLRRVNAAQAQANDDPWPGLNQGENPLASGQSSGEGGGSPTPAPSVPHHIPRHLPSPSAAIPTPIVINLAPVPPQSAGPPSFPPPTGPFPGPGTPHEGTPPHFPPGGPSPGPGTPGGGPPPQFPHDGPFPSPGGIPGRAFGVVVVEQDFSGGGVGLAEVAAALADQYRAQQPIVEQDELQPLYRFGNTADWSQLAGAMTMSGDTATITGVSGSTPQALYTYAGYTQFARAIELGITCDTNKGFALYAFITGSGATLCGYAADYSGGGTFTLYRIDNGVFTSIGTQAVTPSTPATMRWSIVNGQHYASINSGASIIQATDGTYTSGAVGVGEAIGNKGGQGLSGFYVQAPTF